MSRQHRKSYLALCIAMTVGGAFSSAWAASPAVGPEVQFNTKVLEARGFSPDIAKFFARGARFMPGVQQVGVSVNAGRRTMHDVRFNGEGDACFNPALLRQLNLRMPADLREDACADVLSLFPAARLELKPGAMQVNLTVPEEAFDPATRDGASQRGGRAAILNYNVFGQQFQTYGGKQNYLQAQVEPGFNFDNWVVRARGSYTKGAFGSSYQQQTAYAQRNLESMKSLLQLGSFYTSSDSYGGLPVIGAQMFSDSAQLGVTALVVPIQGIAETNAVIELRQRGQLVYRTVVAPGAYSLSEASGLRSGADIEVKVTEEDGRVSRFTVAAPMANGSVDQPATYHLGIGRYRNPFTDGQDQREPWLAYADYAYNLSSKLRVAGGALLSDHYQGTSAQATVNLSDRSWIAMGLNTSHAPGHGLGYEWMMQGSTSLGGNFYGALSWQSRSNGFRAFEDTVGDGIGNDFLARQQTLSGTVSWSSPKWGAYSYTASRSTDSSGASMTHTLTAGRKVGRASLNLSAQKSSNNGLTAYLGMSMPLGKDSISAQLYQNANRTQTYAVSYQGRPNPDFNYQLQGSKSVDTTRLTASAQKTTAYSQLSGGISQTEQGQRSFYGSATGSIVMTADRTLATSASKVGDTFAVVKMPNADGIRLNASGGNGKVSALGTALIPNVYPYRATQMQVDGKSMPLNVRVDNTMLEMNLARGSVATQKIGATEVRQLLLQVKLADGSIPTLGSSVLNDAGEFMGTVVGEGNVVLNNEEIGKPVYVETSGKVRCQVQYTAPEKFDAERPYEEALGTCA